MSWTLYRWAWRVESPLHIGWTPAGALNRTRLYIPARTMWAALTAEIARRTAGDSFPDYQRIGRELCEDVRFTYLFPAEKIENRWLAWLPRYEEVYGLRWHREDDQATPLLDRGFRRRLLATHPGTAIDPASDTATKGSLREFEYVLPHWRDTKGPVAFVGYVFVQDRRDLHERLRDVGELWVGGEVRYGFGRLRRMSLDGDIWQPANNCFGITLDLEGNDPILLEPKFIWAHTLPERNPVNGGIQEVVLGWDRGNPYVEVAQRPCWMPGSRVASGTRLRVLENGLWEKS